MGLDFKSEDVRNAIKPVASAGRLSSSDHVYESVNRQQETPILVAGSKKEEISPPIVSRKSFGPQFEKMPLLDQIWVVLGDGSRIRELKGAKQFFYACKASTCRSYWPGRCGRLYESTVSAHLSESRNRVSIFAWCIYIYVEGNLVRARRRIPLLRLHLKQPSQRLRLHNA